MAVRKKSDPESEGKSVTQTQKAAVTKPVINTKADDDAAKRLAMARAAILKATGQKSVGEDKSARPYVSTGSFLLDHAIGGILAEDGKTPVCPGYPRKAITEIYGAESSGKTTAALEAIAAVQRTPGGTAMFIDFEKALNQRYARKIGVSFDPSKLLFFQPDTMEEGWKQLFIGLKAGVDIVVVDSIAAMVPKEELEKGFDDPARIGALARALSNVLPKIMTWLNDKTISTNPKGTALIFINQVRSTINPQAKGDNKTTPGGMALKFYVFLRIMFTKIRAESVKRKDKFTGKDRTYPYGQHTQAKIVKSKIDGTNGHTTDLFIRYSQGIDNYYSLIEGGIATRVISKSGSTLSYKGHEERSKDKFRTYIVENPAVFQDLKARVLEVVRSEEVIEDLTDEDELMASMANEFGETDENFIPQPAAVEEVEVEGGDFTESEQLAQDDPTAN